jgi:cytoskeleton protein RodZ
MPSIETTQDGMIDSQVPVVSAGDGTMASFGEELRRQRELRSVSLREISDATKINIRFLEALEENEFKHLPGGQFNKGFIRAYARHIGVDGEDMVNAYILEVRRQEEDDRPGRAAAARPRLDPADKRALAALGVLAALVMLLVLGVWYFFFHGRKARVASGAAPSHSSAPAKSAPPSAGSGLAGRPPSVAPSGPAAATSLASASGGNAAAPDAPEPTPSPAGTDAHDSHALAAAAEGDLSLRVVPLAVVRFGLLCDGKDLFSGTLEVGRTLTFTCAGVYEVSVEDAGAVNLSVGGDRIYIGRPGQSIAGRHVSRANLPDFLNPPYEPSR